MGGFGKSQLALDFCERAESNRWFKAIFYVDDSSPNTVAQSYTMIAEKITKGKADRTDLDVNLVMTAVRTWTVTWLLYFR